MRAYLRIFYCAILICAISFASYLYNRTRKMEVASQILSSTEFTFNDNNKVNMLEVNAENFTISSNIIWIDLYNPSDKQRRNIEEKLDITLPTREEMGKIEVINPFYQEDNVKYMTITVPDQSDTEYFNSSALTFVLNSGILITLRYVRLPCWTNFNHLVEIEMKKRGVIQCTGEIFLMILLDLLVNYAADILEVTGNNLDILLKKVLLNLLVLQKLSIVDIKRKILITFCKSEKKHQWLTPTKH